MMDGFNDPSGVLAADWCAFDQERQAFLERIRLLLLHGANHSQVVAELDATQRAMNGLLSLSRRATDA